LEIVDGKLYLNYNKDIQKEWFKDIPAHPRGQRELAKAPSIETLSPQHHRLHSELDGLVHLDKAIPLRGPNDQVQDGPPPKVSTLTALARRGPRSRQRRLFLTDNRASIYL